MCENSIHGRSVNLFPNGVNSRYAYFTDNTLAQVVNRSLTTTIIGSALTHAYTFDALDRLLTVKQTVPLDATKDETYTYDPLNNLTTRAISTPVTAIRKSVCSQLDTSFQNGEEQTRYALSVMAKAMARSTGMLLRLCRNISNASSPSNAIALNRKPASSH